MVTVAASLAEAGLALTPLVLLADDRQIRWIATSELADPTSFLEGGKLLLSTGIQTRQWSAQWTTFVQSLVDAGAVGLGLGVGDGLTYDEAPLHLVEPCRTAGLNLFLVPHQTRSLRKSHRLARMITREKEDAAANSVE